MIDVAGPSLEPVLAHHGPEVFPLLQLAIGAGIGLGTIALFVRTAIGTSVHRAREVAARLPGTAMQRSRRRTAGTEPLKPSAIMVEGWNASASGSPTPQMGFGSHSRSEAGGSPLSRRRTG